MHEPPTDPSRRPPVGSPADRLTDFSADRPAKAADPSPEDRTGDGEGGYLQLPWQLVAGGILLVLVVALLVGLIANENRRQQLVVPTATATVLAAAASPVVVRTATATTAAATVTASAPTVSAVVSPSAAAPAVATRGAAGTTTPLPQAVATALVSPSALPTVDAGLAEEVSQAYQRYWQIRAEAFFALDTSRLNEVMAGEHLDAVLAQIQTLRAQGRALVTDVQHHFAVLEATHDHAWVGDNYVTNSVFVDSQTRTQLNEPGGGSIQEYYELARIEGEWKVVSLARKD